MLTAGGHKTDFTWCDETLQQEDQKKKEEDERAKQLAEAEKSKKRRAFNYRWRKIVFV